MYNNTRIPELEHKIEIRFLEQVRNADVTNSKSGLGSQSPSIGPQLQALKT